MAEPLSEPPPRAKPEAELDELAEPRPVWLCEFDWLVLWAKTTAATTATTEAARTNLVLLVIC